MTDHNCWSRWEENAKSLSDSLLAMTIQGIRDQLRELDAIDRDLGTDKGGIARDELSVLCDEQRRRVEVRAGGRKCHCCGQRVKN